MCFGGKGQQTQTNTPNPQMMQEYLSVMNQANQVASKPLQLYQGPMVAGFTPQQMSAFNEINNAQGIANPFLNTADAYYANANRPIAQEAEGNIAGFESPYTQAVTNATQREFANQNAQQSAALTGNAIASGAYGGDRSGIAQAALAGQEQQAQAPVIAGLEQSGYQSAAQEALQSAETQGQLATQAGFGTGYLGNIAENTALQGASAQLQAGGLQQQLAQEELNVPYQQFQESQQYPFQTTQWLGSLAEGLGGLTGGSSTLTGKGTSGASELAGLGEAGLGAAGNAGSFAALLGKGTGGRIPAWDGGRAERDFGGGLMPHMHRPHFGVMRMHGTHMPHPRMRPSMHMSPTMHHAGFGHPFGGGMGLPGMGVPHAGINAPMGGVPNAGASPVPGFAPGGGVTLARGPSGVSYPVLPMPSNSGPVNITPTSFYSPPNPSTWKTAAAPGTGFNDLPFLTYHGGNPDGMGGVQIPGFQGSPFQPRAPYADGGEDDTGRSFTPNPDGMLAGFSGMGSISGFGGMGPVTGPQYAAMVAPMEANAESAAMAQERPGGLPPIPGMSSPVPAVQMSASGHDGLPRLPFRQADGSIVIPPDASFGSPQDAGTSGTGIGELADEPAYSGAGAGPAQPQSGFGNPNSPWTALMDAGFATMAGNSPSAGVNFGRGALEGMQMWQQARAAQLKAQQEQQAMSLAGRKQDTSEARESETENKDKATEAWHDKQSDALMRRLDLESKRMDDSEKNADRRFGIEEQNANKPNYSIVGTDAQGNLVGMDTHTGKQINLGKLGPKPNAQHPAQQPMPWQQNWH